MYEDFIHACRKTAQGQKHITQNMIAIEIFTLFGMTKERAARYLHKQGNPVKWKTQKLIVDCEAFVTFAVHRHSDAIEKMAHLIGHVHPWNDIELRFGDKVVRKVETNEEIHATIERFFREYYFKGNSGQLFA